jgi:hypothetical protein
MYDRRKNNWLPMSSPRRRHDEQGCVANRRHTQVIDALRSGLRPEADGSSCMSPEGSLSHQNEQL